MQEHPPRPAGAWLRTRAASWLVTLPALILPLAAAPREPGYPLWWWLFVVGLPLAMATSVGTSRAWKVRAGTGLRAVLAAGARLLPRVPVVMLLAWLGAQAYGPVSRLQQAVGPPGHGTSMVLTMLFWLLPYALVAPVLLRVVVAYLDAAESFPAALAYGLRATARTPLRSLGAAAGTTVVALVLYLGFLVVGFASGWISWDGQPALTLSRRVAFAAGMIPLALGVDGLFGAWLALVRREREAGL